ncbi:MAG: sodium:calcium antiporter, partial [Candidatus Edwardsbacteria bacterium]|nr:sodium:calcium antiporter [Candidatus Edwardsbacteria bacterium]
MPVLIWWSALAALIGVIVVAGRLVTRYGDMLGEKLGLSGSWVGVVLLATVTSLPELFSGISSVAIVRQPDLAVGNVLGACVMNVVVVALISACHRDGQLSSRVGREQALSAAMAIVAAALAGIGLFVSRRLLPVTLFDIGLFTILIFGFYLMSQRIIYRHEREHQGPEVEKRFRKVTLRAAAVRFGAAAAVIIAAGIVLPVVAERLAEGMGWGRSFVGSVLMSLATTSPEMAVSFSALRMGQPGMALGNLFGSCIFNQSLLFVDDVFYR